MLAGVIKSSTVDPNVTKQDVRTMSSIPKNIYSQLNNFDIAKIWIYLAAFTEIFVQIWSFSWEIQKKTKVGVYLLKHTREVRIAHTEQLCLNHISNRLLLRLHVHERFFYFPNVLLKNVGESDKTLMILH